MAERVNVTRAATQVPGSSEPSHTVAPQEVTLLTTHDVMAYGQPTEANPLVYTRKTRIDLSRVRVRDWELRGQRREAGGTTIREEHASRIIRNNQIVKTFLVYFTTGVLSLSRGPERGVIAVIRLVWKVISDMSETRESLHVGQQARD